MLPTFIGIGAQKSGTSWIFSCLEEHPEIFMPVKEIHFFSKNKLYCKGLNWYEEQFKTYNHQSQIGEFSTTYLHSNEALNRIYEKCPDAKIIVSLRDPTLRAVSHFKNDIMAGIIPKNSKFSDTLLKKNEYWKRGLYYKKTKWLFQKFGKDKVKVLFIEEAKLDPNSFISSIYRFLKVDDTFIPSSLNQKINVSAVPRSVMIGFIMNFISRLIRKLGLVFIIRYFRNIGIIDLARNANASKNKSFDYAVDWPKEIIEKLDQDRHKLQTLLGKEIKFWQNFNSGANDDNVD